MLILKRILTQVRNKRIKLELNYQENKARIKARIKHFESTK